ncbi:MAG TPA: SEC-C metal-binding domain-containing protein [Reyranella sp.]|nr:SEC-C metal-binding domain-containing protein [Reyranella sp.]
MVEKLGRNDPCPCGSGHRFQGLLPGQRRLSSTGITTRGEDRRWKADVASPSFCAQLSRRFAVRAAVPQVH